MDYTVGRVAEIAGVTVRTLHHYDEIGLLTPGARTSAGYRRYDDVDLERLQQALASEPPDAVGALVPGAMTGSGHGAAGDIALLVFASPMARQPGEGTSRPAAHRLAVMPMRCPHGHTYAPGSFTVTWEYCPCRPSGAAEAGHHLIACHTCAAEERPPTVNIPKCRYLDF